jgi:hypothetical protein
MKPGMRVIDPTIAAIPSPRGPESGPKYRLMIDGGIRYKAMLTRISILRKGTRMFLNIFHPFFNPISVFCRLKTKDIITRTTQVTM